MSIVVQKYGGSSVADLDKIRRVADRIAQTRTLGHQVVVAVSAMGNTTNELIALAREAAERPHRRELDMLISVGERISMTLLSMVLNERGVPARSLTGSQSGIITDTRHANARVLEVRPDRIKTHLEAGEVVIIAGFQGVSTEREVTTLGRGGTDTTAVVLAAALDAEYCEICSDVDGIWSADPRIVADATKLDEISLDEALALARGGAKVLFEDAVKYARDHGVAIRAAETFGPGTGTTLIPRRDLRPAPIAVTGDRQLLRVVLNGSEGAATIRERGGRVRRMRGSTGWVDIRNAHEGVEGPGVEIQEPTAIITAVGSGIGELPSLLFLGTETLRGIAVRASGAAGDVLWWEVPPDSVDEGVRRIHTVRR